MFPRDRKYYVPKRKQSVTQLQVDDFLRRNPLTDGYLSHGPYCTFSRGRMKWNHPKDSVHILLGDNRVEATTKTFVQLPVLEPAVTVHVGKPYTITLG